MNIAQSIDDPFTAQAIARVSRRIEIAPGRTLGIAEYGPKHGPAILYFHGFPSSRIEPAILPLGAHRIIGIDRPGYGLSDPHPTGRNPLDGFADDVVALTDILELKRFALFGMSGGAPYAAALAARHKDRVAALALVSGLGPPKAPGMDKGRASLLLAFGRSALPRALIFRTARRVLISSHAQAQFVRFRRSIAKMESPRDAEAYTDLFARRLMACWREGIARSSAGAEADAAAYTRPWNFGYEDIAAPTTIYHGLADGIVPCAIGQHAATRMPRAESHFIPEEGHISLIVNHHPAIISTLLRHFA